jgi:hypothetical protein
LGRDDSKNFGYAACILIASSGGPGLEVHNNVCEDNVVGITMVEAYRDAPGNCNYSYNGHCWVTNGNVHDNVIASNTSGYAGGGGFPDGWRYGRDNEPEQYVQWQQHLLHRRRRRRVLGLERRRMSGFHVMGWRVSHLDAAKPFGIHPHASGRERGRVHDDECP